MGVDAADFDNSGRAGLAVTNFDSEMIGLYRAAGRRALSTTSRSRAGVGAAVAQHGSDSAALFADIDLDGALDLVVANGHIDDTVRNIRGNAGYAQPPHLFLNQGGGTFRDVAADAGGGFAQPRVGARPRLRRLRRDGDVDLLMTTNNGPRACCSATTRPAGNRSLRFRLVGTKSNRDAHRRDGPHLPRRHDRRRAWSRAARATSRSRSCRSPSGSARAIASSASSIAWPSGRTEEFKDLATGKAYECVEGKGIK